MSGLLHPGDPGRKGLLIVFEGLDGSGKSTQAKALHTHLRAAGYDAVFSFEPTDGPYGRALRELWHKGERHDPEAELDLFRRDRTEHVQTLILPGLRGGTVVILDRYYYSSAAYQGVRGGRSPEEIHNEMTLFAPTPDLTLVCDIPTDIALDRITGGRREMPNVLEARDNLERVKAVFDRMPYPEIHHIDATGTQEEVFRLVLKEVSPLLEKL
ncbi:dTMP kinase [bacterium]|nr:dTMP kinase [bacterium]